MTTVPRRNLILGLALAAVTAGCGSGWLDPPGTMGAVRVSAALQGVAPGQIARVTLTISGGGLASPIVQDFTRVDDTHYVATVASIPAATGYTFSAEAFGTGSPGPVLYRGAMAGVTIRQGQIANVVINLQEVDPTPGPTSRVPVIDGISMSGASVPPGAMVHVAVSAHSPDGHALAYSWQATCGTFSSASEPATVWTAPAEEAVCLLSVRVRDATNATSVTAYLVIAVRIAVGGASVSATINTYPVVTLLADEYVVPAAPAPDGLSVGITADLVATATDPDGDTPTYAWSASCLGGTFTPSSTVAAPRYFQPDPTSACTLTVSVSDGRGGTTTATVELSSFSGALLPGVAVVQVGDGAAALTSAATPVTIRLFALDGTERLGDGFPLQLPTAEAGGNAPLTLSGTATSEGLLTRSADGTYLILAGYGTPPGTPGVSTSVSTTVPRVVARVAASGAVDTSTRIPDGFSGGNVRCAASTDGAGCWVSGVDTTGSVRYVPLGGTTSTALVTTPSNVRGCGIYGGQLYGSSGASGYTDVFSIGSGIPMSSGQPVVHLPGMPTSGASPYGFVLLDVATTPGLDVLYVADDRSTSSGGIQKWVFDGSTWTMEARYSDGAVGYRGLAGFVLDGEVVILATDTTNRLVKLTVSQGVATFVTLATAPTNTAFRGVATWEVRQGP